MSEKKDQLTNGPTMPLGAEFRRAIPTLVLAGLIAIATSWWNTQMTQSELRYRLEAVEKQEKTNAENIAASANQIQSQAVKFAEVGATQNNMLEHLREIKQEQEEIKRELRGK
jgi:hypothetical protein